MYAQILSSNFILHLRYYSSTSFVFSKTMRNIATCYNEHTVHVSDSYCSRPSKQSLIFPNYTPSTQKTTICVYKINLPTKPPFFITLTWSNFPQRALAISINKKSFHVKYLKGAKKFESSNSIIKLIWDIFSAKYEGGPQPIKGYYIALFVNSELSFFLGDKGQLEEIVSDARISNSYNSLVTHGEYFFGGDLFSTKAKFFEGGMCHDILIKGVVENKGILGVWIDGKNVVEVKRLKWNFRGNQGVFIDGSLVDFMWDVYDWFFDERLDDGCGIFLFRPRSGLDSRLWLEEKEQERVGISLMICCKKPQ